MSTLRCSVCGRPYKTQRGLDAHVADKHPSPVVESTIAAVERVRASVEITPARAVLAAQVRRVSRVQLPTLDAARDPSRATRAADGRLLRS